MFGDKQTVVDSSTVPQAKLHKRHTILSFHHVCEAIASGMIAFYHLPEEINPADTLSKHWGYTKIWSMLQPLLFWQGDTADLLHWLMKEHLLFTYCVCFTCPFDSHWIHSGKWGVTTFEEVLSHRPDSNHEEILAWGLIGFPSGPLPVLHTYLVLKCRQCCSPTANASGLPPCW